MVLPVDSVPAVLVPPALPVQNLPRECVRMSMTMDGQALGNTLLMSSLTLVHPEDIGSCPEQKQEDQYLAAIFASAALQSAVPGLGLGPGASDVQ